jgi:hypothetical protein
MYSSSSNSNNKKIKSRITVYKTTADNSIDKMPNNKATAEHTGEVIKPGFLKFYRNDLVKGIIFSEILGKPRAFKKFKIK